VRPGRRWKQVGNSNESTTMPLMPLTDEEWPAELEAYRGGFATELNVYRVMAHHPALLDSWAALRNHLTHGGVLPARWRELAILRTARFINSEYEWAHHVERGRKAGLTEAEIDAVARDCLWESFPGAESVVLRMTDALLDRTGLSPEEVEVALKQMSAQQLLDLMATVGMYLTLGFVVKSFRTPLERPLGGT
jgi:4-carboxymuconolactone decarboxylase